MAQSHWQLKTPTSNSFQVGIGNLTWSNYEKHSKGLHWLHSFWKYPFINSRISMFRFRAPLPVASIFWLGNSVLTLLHALLTSWGFHWWSMRNNGLSCPTGLGRPPNGQHKIRESNDRCDLVASQLSLLPTKVKWPNEVSFVTIGAGQPITNQSGVVSGSWPSTHMVTVKLSSKTSAAKTNW